jgi:hypothetical protein
MFSNRIARLLAIFLLHLPILAGASLAAEPPDLVNYQGVLRGSDDSPLEGDHDMVFRFWSAEVGGAEILVDSHTAAGSGAVTLSGGLFDVQLGGGTVSDGSGAGVYDTLGRVFADYSAVWLEIQIGGEVLSPRVRVVSSPYAANAMHLGGKSGDQFVDTTSSVQSKLGRLVVGQASGTGSAYGVEGYGTVGGGYFKDSNSSGYARVGTADYGVRGYGNSGGGYFEDLDGSGYAYVGYGDYGAVGYGNTGGGYFEDLDGSGYAYVGYGDYGTEAYGNSGGGHFEDLDSSAIAYVGSGNYGVSGFGNYGGGYFSDRDGSGYAYVGYGDYGISAKGDELGGYFKDLNDSGRALAGYADDGIHGYGNHTGGYFEDLDESGQAEVAVGGRGIWARGDFAGGTFSSVDGVTHWTDVSRERSGTTYKIYGTGQVSFVQNHPLDKDKLVVYAAPEGDEVATYTRGTARLVGGEARVELGETFAWVTNPDVGLTAHLTPRNECRGLYVASLTTDEMIVRELDGGTSDASFDYLVYGLRIGFEQHAAVQIKDQEAFLPRRGASEEFFAEHPGLQRYSALERFKEMRAALGESEEIDLSRAEALIAAIDDNREEIVAAARAEAEAERAGHLETPSEQRSSDELPDSVSPRASEPITASEVAVMAEATTDERTWLPVAEPVELGDVLVLDPARPGFLRRATTMSDAAVVGIAAGPAREADDGGLEAPVADARYAVVKVDAGYGEIRPGDRLASSPTPGHAMRVLETDSGAVLGRALDSLEIGTGTVRVLLLTR